MGPDHRYTKWSQRVRLALELTRHDVVEIMAAGGVTVSSSRADGWMRRRDVADGRRTVMSEAEFDAFTRGLVEWSRRSPPPRG